MVTALQLERRSSGPIELVLPHQDYQPLGQIPGTWHFALWPTKDLLNHDIMIDSGSTKIIKPIEQLVRTDRLPRDVLNSIRQAEQTKRFDVFLLAASTGVLLKPAGRLDDELLVVGFDRTKKEQPVRLGQRGNPTLSDILPRLFVNGGDGFIISPNHIPHLRLVDKNPAGSQ